MEKQVQMTSQWPTFELHEKWTWCCRNFKQDYIHGYLRIGMYVVCIRVSDHEVI